MMFFGRLLQLYRRRRIAKQYGFIFKRSANFQMPDHININNNRHRLHLPDENGVKIAVIDLLLDDCYGLKKLAQPIRNVLDIGANVGLFSLYARSVFPEAVIHAYEPNANLEKYLQIQAQAAGFEYFMEAVGKEDGRVSLDFNEDSVQTRSRIDKDGQITQVAFRQAIERLGGYCDLVKLDCEGAEWKIFQDKEAWRPVKHLSMEYHLWPDHTHDEIEHVVKELSFKIKRQRPITNYGLIMASR